MFNRLKISDQNQSSKNAGAFFQPKLVINPPSDVYEQEADAVAEQILNNPASENNHSFFKPSVSSIQRKCAHCEEEEKNMQRREKSNDAMNTSAVAENYINTISGGSTLDEKDKTFFESRMGYDFSGVKIHTDSAANQSAKNINALAYTHDKNIVFGAGQYNPHTSEGKKLMAHELTHVVQQTGTIQRKTACSYEKFEHEITGVGAGVKLLKAIPVDAEIHNLPGEPVVDGDAVKLKNEGGALEFNNVKNCTWAWVEIPGKKSSDKAYPVLHGFIETKYLKSKAAPAPVTPAAPAPVAPSEKMSFIEGPEIIYPGGQFEYTAHALGPLLPPVDFSDLKWAFQYDTGAINVFDTSKGLSVDDDTATLNVFIPADKKADKVTIYAYTTSPESGASKETLMKPVSVVESEKDKGKKEDGTVADDMLSGDFTPDQIKDIRLAFREDYFFNYTDEQLFDALKLMATTLFSTGDLETNALAMIEHFKGNSGSDYSNPILTKAVEAHESTKGFVTHVKMELSKKVLAEKEGLQQTAVTKGAIEEYRPVFNSLGDTFAGGLTFAINDTWAYQSEILYYDYKTDKDFKGTLKVTLYDDFGLDKPDVEKKFGHLRGFRAWFILQHDRGYKPFVTVVEMELPFDESITEIEPKMKEEEASAKERAEYEKTFKPPRPGTRF